MGRHASSTETNNIVTSCCVCASKNTSPIGKCGSHCKIIGCDSLDPSVVHRRSCSGKRAASVNPPARVLNDVSLYPNAAGIHCRPGDAEVRRYQLQTLCRFRIARKKLRFSTMLLRPRSDDDRQCQQPEHDKNSRHGFDHTGRTIDQPRALQSIRRYRPRRKTPPKGKRAWSQLSSGV